MKVIGLTLLTNGDVKVSLKDGEGKQPSSYLDVVTTVEASRHLHVNDEVDLKLELREGDA